MNIVKDELEANEFGYKGFSISYLISFPVLIFIYVVIYVVNATLDLRDWMVSERRKSQRKTIRTEVLQ
jgi:hypothetical protein